MAFACCKPSTVKCMEGLKSAASVYMEERDVTWGNPITLKMFKLVIWRQIRTVSLSAKIENLQNHKTIFENKNSYISHTYSQRS